MTINEQFKTVVDALNPVDMKIIGSIHKVVDMIGRRIFYGNFIRINTEDCQILVVIDP